MKKRNVPFTSRGIALVLVAVMVFAMLPMYASSEARATSAIEYINLPITIRDAIYDGVLFENDDLNCNYVPPEGGNVNSAYVSNMVSSQLVNGVPYYSNVKIEGTYQWTNAAGTNNVLWYLAERLKTADMIRTNVTNATLSEKLVQLCNAAGGQWVATEDEWDIARLDENVDDLDKVVNRFQAARWMLNHLFKDGTYTDVNGNTQYYTRSNEYYHTLRLELSEYNGQSCYSYVSKGASTDFNSSTGVIQNATSGVQIERGGWFPLNNKPADASKFFSFDENLVDGVYNYSTTTAGSGEFVYRKGANLFFAFTGDDDVFLYINDILVIDNGGTHREMVSEVYLDKPLGEGKLVTGQRVAGQPTDGTWADYLGLVEGETYSFDFFQMERKEADSNFAIYTNMNVVDSSAVTQKKAYNAAGQELPFGASVKSGDEITYEFVMSNNSKVVENVTDEDDTNKEFIEGTQIENSDFETGDLSGWTLLDGTAITADNNSVGAVSSDDRYWTENYSDRYFLKEGTYFLRGDVKESVSGGAIRSSDFVLGGDGYVSFLIGTAATTAKGSVKLYTKDGKLVKAYTNPKWSDPHTALTLIRIYDHQPEYIGETMYFVVENGVDTSGFAFINVDDFRTSMTVEEVVALQKTEQERIAQIVDAYQSDIAAAYQECEIIKNPKLSSQAPASIVKATEMNVNLVSLIKGYTKASATGVELPVAVAVTGVAKDGASVDASSGSLTLQAGTYVITYDVTYAGITETKTMTIQAKAAADIVYEIKNGGFETGDLTGWTPENGSNNVGEVSGDAMYWVGNSSENPAGKDRYFFKHGNYFLRGDVKEKTAGGTIRSSSFVLGGDGYISFLIGAAATTAKGSVKLYAEDGQLIATYTNEYWKDPETALTLIRIYDHLPEHIGESMYFVVENGTDVEGFAFINVDDFRTSMTEEAVMDLYFDDLARVKAVAEDPCKDYITGINENAKIYGTEAMIRSLVSIEAGKVVNLVFEDAKLGVKLSKNEIVLGDTGIGDILVLKPGATKYVSVTENELKELLEDGLAPGQSISIKGFKFTVDGSEHLIQNTLLTEAVGVVHNQYTTITGSDMMELQLAVVANKVFVIDFAKTVTYSQAQIFQSELTALLAAQEGVTKSITSITLQNSTDNVTKGVYGTMRLNNGSDGYSLTYTPGTFMGGKDTFVLKIALSTTNANSNITSVTTLSKTITVIPANNVYYEDSFVQIANSGFVGIEFSGTYVNVSGAGSNNTHDPLNPNAYGWEETFGDDLTDGDGTYVGMSSMAKATFTFTGTGVDIYSRTNINSGIAKLTVTKLNPDGTKDESVKPKSMMVNCKSESGEFYNIPTAFMQGLEYGKYRAELQVISTAAQMDETVAQYVYCLDGIRVYHPIQNIENTDSDVQGAYGSDNELNATFTTVRDILLNPDGAENGAFKNSGAVYIDHNTANDGIGDVSSLISVYEKDGPKNEVYLAKGQSIMFKVATGASQNYYLGMKNIDGKGTTVRTTFSDAATEREINTTVDMYYQIVPDSNGYVTITNDGDGILSITKLRCTNGGVVEVLAVEEVQRTYDSFALLPVVEVEEESDLITEPAEPGAEMREFAEELFGDFRDLFTY